jgi:hypothetical protein
MLHTCLLFNHICRSCLRSLQLRMASNGPPQQQLPVISHQQDNSSIFLGLRKQVRIDLEELRPHATKRTYGNNAAGPVKMFKDWARAEPGL